MAVCFDGGVVLGADSRTSTGSYVANRVSDKIVPVQDHIWACRSGSAADTQAVIDYVKHYTDAHSTELGRLPKVSACASLMRQICYNNKDNLMAGLICAGWDPYEGGQVYEIPLGGTIMKQKFAMGGSGSTYIYGLVDHTYRDGMTKEECKDFVKNGNQFVNMIICVISCVISSLVLFCISYILNHILTLSFFIAFHFARL